MKIIVLIKEVPDTWGDRKLNLETGLADRGANDKVADEIGERANECAISYAQSHPDTEVVLVSAGPESVPTTLRKGLAMGASSAIHVQDQEMVGADLTLTAEVLSKAIRKTGFDLVIAGNLSTDGSGGVMAAMVAELLDVPHATNLNSIEIVDGQVRGERATDTGTMQVTAPLPAVVSITERLPDPRFPNFKGIMAAKKKPLQTLTLKDIGVDPNTDVPRSIMLAVAEKPPRSAGTKIVDDGDGGNQLAEFLVQSRLV